MKSFCFQYLVLFGLMFPVTAQNGCIVESFASSSATGENVIQTATADALAVAITNVQSGSSCAQAAANAVAQATSNATAEAAVDVYTRVTEGCEGVATASGQSFAESTAIAVADATAAAFAQVLGVAEAQALANSVSTDVETAIATAEATAISTGGVAEASAASVATAVAEAVAEAYAEALANFNSDDCKGVTGSEPGGDDDDDIVPSPVVPVQGDVITSIDLSSVQECAVTTRPCQFTSFLGSAGNCCQADLDQTVIASECTQEQDRLNVYSYKGLCLKSRDGNLGTFALVLGRSFARSSIKLTDCICEDNTLTTSL
eukprot:TRINITY_DN7635_c0_g2_i3.p1 TRINITY_DN7635_c0_g2~~TRINITY_DN7635_c0_g2_i3.p1  ORF type:complete len:318 (-),score=67.33 TRINITY_DN7635_c0_g2_i3:121-1074(-)